MEERRLNGDRSTGDDKFNEIPFETALKFVTLLLFSVLFSRNLTQQQMKQMYVVCVCTVKGAKSEKKFFL